MLLNDPICSRIPRDGDPTLYNALRPALTPPRSSSSGLFRSAPKPVSGKDCIPCHMMYCYAVISSFPSQIDT